MKEAADSGWLWQTGQQPFPRGAGALDRNLQRRKGPEKASAGLRPGWEPQRSLESRGEGLTPGPVWDGEEPGLGPACCSVGRLEEPLPFRPVCGLWMKERPGQLGPRKHTGALGPTLPASVTSAPLCLSFPSVSSDESTCLGTVKRVRRHGQ